MQLSWTSNTTCRAVQHTLQLCIQPTVCSFIHIQYPNFCLTSAQVGFTLNRRKEKTHAKQPHIGSWRRPLTSRKPCEGPDLGLFVCILSSSSSARHGILCSEGPLSGMPTGKRRIATYHFVVIPIRFYHTTNLPGNWSRRTWVAMQGQPVTIVGCLSAVPFPLPFWYVRRKQQ